jgi:hypothetical protein
VRSQGLLGYWRPRSSHGEGCRRCIAAVRVFALAFAGAVKRRGRRSAHRVLAGVSPCHSTSLARLRTASGRLCGQRIAARPARPGQPGKPASSNRHWHRIASRRGGGRKGEGCKIHAAAPGNVSPPGLDECSTPTTILTHPDATRPDLAQKQCGCMRKFSRALPKYRCSTWSTSGYRQNHQTCSVVVVSWHATHCATDVAVRRHLKPV